MALVVLFVAHENNAKLNNRCALWIVKLLGSFKTDRSTVRLTDRLTNTIDYSGALRQLSYRTTAASMFLFIQWTESDGITRAYKLQ